MCECVFLIIFLLVMQCIDILFFKFCMIFYLFSFCFLTLTLSSQKLQSDTEDLKPFELIWCRTWCDDKFGLVYFLRKDALVSHFFGMSIMLPNSIYVTSVGCQSASPFLARIIIFINEKCICVYSLYLIIFFFFLT